MFCMDLQQVKQRFGIVGNNDAFNRALEIAIRVAPTDLTVLITGESGVGKEFFPQIIHQYSHRKHSHYIAVNCGAIPEGTIDSELFGHEKGAFTGASDSRKGYFEMADGGTIFLDEVGELPLQTQVRLLRVLQSGEYIRVGSSKVQKTNVRVVAATNKDLGEAIKGGTFREDLYYRLSIVPVEVPPLRERKQDVYLLFRKFASDIAEQYHMQPIALDAEAKQMLMHYPWPGNIRQLKNVAEQISAVEESRLVTTQVLGKYLTNYTPALYGDIPAQDYGNGERDIFFKILVDMRNDILEIKRMLREGGLRGGVPEAPKEGTTSLLPAPMAPGNMYVPVDVAPQHHEAAEELPKTKEAHMKEAIENALRKHGGRRKEAARELFISERTLYRKIKELGIDV